MTHYIRSAFADITRRLPGRYDKLQAHLADAPPQAQQDFQRLIQDYEYALDNAERKARWLR